MGDRLAYGAVQFARGSFDFATNYGTNMTEEKWLNRMIFLETVAGVPGMVGAMCRHFNSLRSMKRDQGWLHELLAEAENERAHLLTFLELKQPGIAFRAMVLLAQGVFFNAYFLAYLVSPSTCHRFVQYLEEEAVKTYTKAVQQVDDPEGGLDKWRQMPASPLSRKYWQLPEDAMFRDVLMAIRADEAIHRDVNGTLADLPADAPNPFA